MFARLKHVTALAERCTYLERQCKLLDRDLRGLEAAVMADPAIRDRIKFQQMAQQVVDVAMAEGQLLPPIEPGEPPL
jgi:hypothetical protein